MDLEPIEERANEFATWVGKFDSEHRIPAAFASAADVPALLAEVERLRSICEDHALCADAISTLREEVTRLSTAVSAHPAPAWDEEAVLVALVDAHLASVRQVMEDGYPSIFVRSNEDAADAALAVVREHLPVKPSREEVAEAMLGSDIITDDLRAEASAQGSTQREPFLCFADAILDLLPGRSEAEVKAEALRDFAARVRDEMDDSDKVLGTKWATDEYRHGMRSALMQATERADRLGGSS